MTQPFLIRHPETGVQYELADVAFFVDHYKPQGFKIVDPAPMNYTVPDLEAVESPDVEAPPPDDPKDPESADLETLTRVELNVYAAELGIDNPEGHSNKAALIEVIEAKRAE